MTARTITIELPDELLAILGDLPTIGERAREALVLALLRDAEISQGKAAQLLGITRWDILQLMARHRIESGPETAEEMERDIENARRFSTLSPVHDRG
jgi:predicted HTH domain antitoxin